MSEDLVKLSKTPGRVPKVSDLAGFKFAWNSRDGKLYGLKDNGNGTYSVVPVGQDVLQVAETDPTFQAWLAGFVASAQVQSDYTQADNAQPDYIKNKPQTKLAALTDNSDFPASYLGQALKAVRVRADEQGTEFFTIPTTLPASDVYAWAKAATKPAYTYTEVGAEPANANIQIHIGSSHAPANAQKNSDITQAEIEAKLIGEIISHSHPGGSGGLTQQQIEGLI